MRVTSVKLHVDGSEALSFSLRNLDPSSRYQVKTIFGMDADEIMSKFYGFGATSNAKHYELFLPPRDIVMRVALNPFVTLGETASDIRDNVYRAVSSSRTGEIELRFNSGISTVATIQGFIKKIEAPYFSNIPEIQITVKCKDPMFRGPITTKYLTSDISEANPITIVDAQSTAPHGFDMQVTFNATVPSFKISDEGDTEWSFEVIPSDDGFLLGDVLYFSSKHLMKQLYFVRGGNTFGLLDKIAPFSSWPILFPKSNQFAIQDRASLTVNEISFKAAYWGV